MCDGHTREPGAALPEMDALATVGLTEAAHESATTGERVPVPTIPE